MALEWFLGGLRPLYDLLSRFWAGHFFTNFDPPEADYYEGVVLPLNSIFGTNLHIFQTRPTVSARFFRSSWLVKTALGGHNGPPSAIFGHIWQF